MRNLKRLNSLLASFILSACFIAPAMAENAFENFSQGATHSSAASTHSVIASAQALSAVAAVPLKFTGAVGEISAKAGDKLWSAAKGEPELEISDKTLTTGPRPDLALAKR